MAVKRHDPCNECQRIKTNGDCLGCATYELEVAINKIEWEVGGCLRTVSNIIRDLLHPKVSVRKVIADLDIKPYCMVGGVEVFSPASFQRIKVEIMSKEKSKAAAVLSI